MKPYETTLPAARVQVLKAELLQLREKQILSLDVVLRELIRHFTLIGDDIHEIRTRLRHEIGFDDIDAAHIVQRASHATPAFN